MSLTDLEGGAQSLRLPAYFFAGESYLGCNQKESARAVLEKLIRLGVDSKWVKFARDRLNSDALK